LLDIKRVKFCPLKNEIILYQKIEKLYLNEMSEEDVREIKVLHEIFDSKVSSNEL